MAFLRQWNKCGTLELGGIVTAVAEVNEPVRPTHGLVRLTADAGTVAAGLFTAVVVARSLGPDGKGLVSALGYVTVLLGAASAMGVGEAGSILLGRRAVSFELVVSVAVGMLVVSTAVAAAFLLILTSFGWGAGTVGFDGARITAALAVVPTAATSVLARLLEGRGRFNAASAGRAAMSLTTAVATFVLLVALNGGVASAVVAMLLGAVAYLLVLLREFARLGTAIRPLLKPQVARQLIRIGLPLQAATLMVGLTSRVDLLILLSYRGASAAGRYGVATTVAGLAGYGATALAAVTFPGVSSLSPEASAERTAMMTRWALIVSAGSAGVLGTAAAVLIPVLFGGEFMRSVGLTFVLLPGAVLAAAQWVLGRLGASSGRGSITVVSHGAALVVLVVGAVVLVPSGGEAGAALSSVAASALGFCVAARLWCRHTGMKLGVLVPRWRDTRVIVDALLRDVPLERVTRLRCRSGRRPPSSAPPRAPEPPGS